ncbi:MAG: hypothetical protein PHT51_03325 [Patescibacteria group bacterium]|nr:hypothetical protein [Patescibacteria group bacterium]
MAKDARYKNPEEGGLDFLKKVSLAKKMKLGELDEVEKTLDIFFANWRDNPEAWRKASEVYSECFTSLVEKYNFSEEGNVNTLLLYLRAAETLAVFGGKDYAPPSGAIERLVEVVKAEKDEYAVLPFICERASHKVCLAAAKLALFQCKKADEVLSFFSGDTLRSLDDGDFAREFFKNMERKKMLLHLSNGEMLSFALMYARSGYEDGEEIESILVRSAKRVKLSPREAGEFAGYLPQRGKEYLAWYVKENQMSAPEAVIWFK